MLFREEDADLDVLPFANRGEAGRMLASGLAAYSGRRDVIVLGLSRGGVPVASAVANALHVSLDAFVVSKLGIPWNENWLWARLPRAAWRCLIFRSSTYWGSRRRISTT